MMGSDPTDVISMKRWLAFLEGGLLPIISLTSLHFFVKYESNKNEVISEVVDKSPVESDINETNINKLTDLQVEANKVWDKVKELKEDGKLPPDLTDEEKLEEPTALAFTPYEDEEETKNTTLTENKEIENTKFPMDKMMEFDDSMTTTTTNDDYIKRLSYVKNI